MTSVQYKHGTVAGFEAVTADTGPLALTILPALGGKISSLRDQRSGREWLWRHPRLAYNTHGPGESYIHNADTGGWDECFPTVAPCTYPHAPWQGAVLPDHGELWCQPATVTVEPDGSRLRLRTLWRGLALPYSFEREIVLEAGSARIRCDYAVMNQGDAPLTWIWSMHPLIAIEPRMQLRLPQEARFNLWAAVPSDLLAQAQDIGFPAVSPTQTLDPLPGPDAALALKLWSDPLAVEGWAELHASTDTLRFRWAGDLPAQAAFWLNAGAWSADGVAPYYNLGLEPCIGGQDSLELAAVHGQPLGHTAPGAVTRWWVEVECS